MSLIIAQKYSKALLEVAQEHQQLDEILAEVANFDQVIKATNLTDFLADVTYADEKDCCYQKFTRRVINIV